MYAGRSLGCAACHAQAAARPRRRCWQQTKHFHLSSRYAASVAYGLIVVRVRVRIACVHCFSAASHGGRFKRRRSGLALKLELFASWALPEAVRDCFPNAVHNGKLHHAFCTNELLIFVKDVPILSFEEPVLTL